MVSLKKDVIYFPMIAVTPATSLVKLVDRLTSNE